MKVLYITGMYPTPTYPQKGIFCHEQVKALKKLGVDVDVIVPMTIYDKEYPNKIWEYEGVVIKYIRFFKMPGLRFFERTGQDLYFSLIHSGIDFSQYDVLHADAPLPTGDAVKRISRKFSIPYVIHGHGLDVFLGESYAEAKNCDAIVRTCINVYKDAAAVIGVSQKVLDKIQVKVNIQDKGFVAYNGVDTNKFYPMEHHNKKIVIISVGNLIWLKGHEYTLEAVRNINRKYPDRIRVYIIGRGILEDKLKNLAQEFGIQNIVKFKGYISYDKVRSYLQKSDMFVLPSYYEALGCVYLEAMACGIPVIGCYENGIDEVIESGVDGFLVHNQRVDELQECMEKLLDEQLRLAVGVNGRNKVVNHYRWTDSAETVKKIYEWVCE